MKEVNANQMRSGSFYQEWICNETYSCPSCPYNPDFPDWIGFRAWVRRVFNVSYLGNSGSSIYRQICAPIGMKIDNIPDDVLAYIADDCCECNFGYRVERYPRTNSATVTVYID